MGVELEVECADYDDRERVAFQIHQQHKQDVLIKEDGSLDRGFELVTGAFSLDEHKKMWPNLASNALRAGARSWRYKSTGLHVHLSRSFFTPLEIGKMLVFLNSPSTREHIVALAGRTSPDFAAIEKKQLKDAYKFRYGRSWDGSPMRNRRPSISVCGGHRYEILNLQNGSTVEVRIFKGTLSSTHILANIEFCHCLAHWVKTISAQESENWSSFWDYANNNRKPYREFLLYMATKGKIADES